MRLPRNSYDECVDYIASEFDKANADLPVHFTTQSNQEYGRITQLFCMAYKARLLLYAASPLFNGNPDYGNFRNKDGKALMNTTYDANKWKRAADAAKAVIDLNLLSIFKKNDAGGNFDPLLSYRDVFLTAWNTEWIFARNNNSLSTHERQCSPRQSSGYASSGVTQAQVDADFMANGKSPITGYNADGTPIIDAASGYTETGFSTVADKYTRVGTFNMWMNREPRFYASVNYNGAQWINALFRCKALEDSRNNRWRSVLRNECRCRSACFLCAQSV